MHRKTAWSLVVVAFVVVPLVEIYLLIQVGQVIGPWWTIGLLVADSLVGGYLVRREGGRAWRALQTALRAGSMPARELADGALILVGGTLLLTPGFATDVLGFFLLVPLTRPLARRLLTRLLTRRLLRGAVMAPMSRPPSPHASGPVVPGDVVDDSRSG